MSTVLSKIADGKILPHDPQPGSEQGPDVKSEVHTQLPSSDELQSSTKKQYTTHRMRVPELLNPASTSSEMMLPESSQSAEEQPGLTQPESDNWNDKKTGLTLGNGQLRLKIENWQTPCPTFIVENNPKGNPKGNLQGVVEGPKLVYIDFTIPTNHPGGMLGIMQSIEALFMFPQKIGMKNIEPGCAAADRESNNPKRESHYIDWTSQRDTCGCRVTWMKAKETSPIIKFKFVSRRNERREEQMIATVDERDPFYQMISKKDPNTYGQYMALPVRIWLRIQWMIAETGDTGDSKLFGKLIADHNPPFRRKNKGRMASKNMPNRAQESSTAQEGSSKDEKSDASVVPRTRQSVLGQEHTMEIMGSQELTEEELLHEESPHEESTEKGLAKRVSTLTIDTQKSNKRSKGKGKRKGKRTPGWSGSDSGKKDADHVTRHIKECVTDQRGDQHCDNQRVDLLSGVQDIARRDVQTEQQLAAVAGQQTVNAPRSPITPITPNGLTAPFSPSFETARTHPSPHTPLPSSSLSPFFTPMSTPWKKENRGEGGVQAEENEPAEDSDELCSTPRGDEVGIRCPVSDNRDEVWFSDPEEYLGGHEAQEPVLRRSQSFDPASLGLFRDQEIASSSPTADPRSPSRASSAILTTDSAGFGTNDPSSDGTVQSGDQSPAESSRYDRKSVYKQRKHVKRMRRKLIKRQQERSADAERTVSSASSQGDGVEGRSPSPPESFEDDEPTPTAKQFGNIGAPAPEAQMDPPRLGIVCEEKDCQVLCVLGDGVSVVCPKCGPFSLVRYCGKNHLWEDAKRHWPNCTKQPVLEQHLAGLIPYDDLVGPPMLPSLHQWDSPERHRQALWFSSARDRGDYFVFAELNTPVNAADAPASHAGRGCSPRIVYIVRFEDAEEKDRFRRCLAICLFAAVEHPALVDYLYRLVRDWMRAHNMWASDKDMDSMLCRQMGLEMGGTIDKSRLGLRHACETEWVGADRRHCEDLACASERRPTLLGNHRMGLGFRRVCEALESNYWILRAHRATHPSVSDVVARTCGAGFSEVLSMDRRLFCRGVGWDGAGTGPMELEMPWSG
ncbi:hypothetical protein PCG10_002266 [Penicillium crustosum]|uniref:Uncharacterized protein n=1 Tax=Penicillium crustosum TaxID=36656 RepID=A0A9P5L5S4_PENCR|nr:hypothetical protein PCG10_002266 [Penicillium crustosum]